MRRIALGDCDWTTEYSSECCGRFGGIDAVLNGMRAHAHVPAVQEYGCVALDVLALNSANQERVAAAGGIEVMDSVEPSASDRCRAAAFGRSNRTAVRHHVAVEAQHYERVRYGAAWRR